MQEQSDLVQHTLNQLNLIGNLCTAEDRKERTFRPLQRLGEELEFFFDEESRGTLREFYPNHTGMGPMGGPKRIVHVDVAEFREVLAELRNLDRICLYFLAILILGGSLLLDVEPKVLQENDRPFWGGINSRLDVGSNAIFGEYDFLLEQFAQFLGDRSQGVFWDDFPIWATEMGHEGDLGGTFRGSKSKAGTGIGDKSNHDSWHT